MGWITGLEVDFRIMEQREEDINYGGSKNLLRAWAYLKLHCRVTFSSRPLLKLAYNWYGDSVEDGEDGDSHVTARSRR